jgi:hypothetical protein
MSDDFLDFKYVVNSGILSHTTLNSGAGYVFGEHISSHFWSTPKK